MAEHQVEKRVIPGKVRGHDHRVFTVAAATASEQEIVLHFSRRVDYSVVKLSTKGLPLTTSRGGKIHWLNNFGIKAARGGYQSDVSYTTFFWVREGAGLVYYDHRGLHRVRAPKRLKGGKPQLEMVYLDLHTGDPGIGCD